MPIRKIRPLVIPVGPSIAYVELTQGQWCLIDSEDAPVVGQFNWHAHFDKNTGCFYAYRTVRLKDGKYVQIQMHRLVMGATSSVDHKAGSTLDNRKSQLRLATGSQNAINKRMQTNNSSGYRGVWSSGRKWQAEITINRKRTFLGTFTTPELASAAYRAASIGLHGEFRR